MITLYFEGVLLGLLVAISLGPAFFAIIQTSINKGFKYGVFMAMGISLSDISLVTISYLIGATLFDDPQNKVYVGLIGGIILIIFGSVSWAKKPEILKRRHVNYQAPSDKPLFVYTIRGFFMNVANPFLFFFWFGALGFVGKNAVEGEMLESTIAFFAGTFSTVFATDLLKSYIGDKIKGFLRPRKELLLNKIVGIALVVFGVILIFRTLNDIGFFERLETQVVSEKTIEAKYDIKTKYSNLDLILYKDSSFVSKVIINDSAYRIAGSWTYQDTAHSIFEITIHESNVDSIQLSSKRMYKLNITGIEPYTDLSTTTTLPNSFDVKEDFQLFNIEKSTIIVPDKENLPNSNCTDWSLNAQQISTIIKDAEVIDANTWKKHFDFLPCIMSAEIRQGTNIYTIQVNAGSWFTISVNDSNLYYGSYKIENQGLFLSTPKK